MATVWIIRIDNLRIIVLLALGVFIILLGVLPAVYD